MRPDVRPDVEVGPAVSVLRSARLLDGTGAPAVDDAWVALEAGRVTAVGSGGGWESHAGGPSAGEVLDLDGAWLLPGSVDVHRHGGGGRAHEEGPDAVLAAARAHLAHGTTAGVVSFASADVDELAEHLATTADLVAEHPGLLLGSHLEGPFLSEVRCGAHEVAKLRDPSPAAVRHLLEAARGTLRQVTLDPGRPGAREAAEAFTAAGTVVAVGHTEASAEQAAEAFDAGARLLTHAFNAMPGIHHRAPGPVVAAAEDPRVVLEVILDGEHVDPRVVAALFAMAPGRVALITDAAPPAAGGPVDHPYRLGALAVEVVGGRVVLAGTTTLAGSVLTLDQALRVGAAAGIALPALVRAMTSTPAAAVGAGDRGVLRPGAVADLVVLDADLRVTGVHTPATGWLPSPRP